MTAEDKSSSVPSRAPADAGRPAAALTTSRTSTARANFAFSGGQRLSPGEREDRALSNLCERLLAWSAEWLAVAGDSQTLMDWEARPRRAISKRITAETQQHLYTALEALLERAPSAVIEDVARYLTSKAGKYGESR